MFVFRSFLWLCTIQVSFTLNYFAAPFLCVRLFLLTLQCSCEEFDVLVLKTETAELYSYMYFIYVMFIVREFFSRKFYDRLKLYRISKWIGKNA